MRKLRLILSILCLVLALLVIASRALARPDAAHGTSAALIQQAATQAAADAAPTTNPVVTQVVGNDGMTELQRLENNRLMQLYRGKEKASLHDMFDPILWFRTIQDLVLGLVAFLPRLLVAFLFLVIFWLIHRLFRRVIVGSMSRAHVDQSIRDMLGHFIKWSVMGFGLVIACNQIGVQIAALLTGVSIIGLAIGFAAQETLANFIAAIVIIWDKPFRVGEWVTVDNLYAKVSRVTFRSTRLLNHEGETLLFPNTYMLANKLVNHSTHPVARVNIAFGVAYNVDLSKVRAAVLKLLHGDTRICDDPRPEIVLDECAANSLNLLLRFWAHDESMLSRLRHEYLEKAKLALDAAGIEIPGPKLQVTLTNPPAAPPPKGGA